MKDPAEPASSATTLRSALLDYFEAPGKYQLTLRQPALLFSSIREILQLASGRGAAEAGAPQADRLREAANFFIRAALLYPGADHYAVLGLPPGEAPPDLKERYRLLMRLIHPDYAAGPAEWPADAAVRVNRAYEILSSPVQRREYDEQLASLRKQRPAAPVMPPSFHTAARRSEERPKRVGKKAALVFGLAVGIPAVLLLLPRAEPDHLVQRTGPVPVAQQEAAPSAPAALAPTGTLAPSAVVQAPAATLPEPARAAPAAPSASLAPAAAPAPVHTQPAVVAVRPAAPPQAAAPHAAPVTPPARPAAVALAPVQPAPRPAAPVQPPPNPILQARAPEPVRAAPVAPEPVPVVPAPPIVAAAAVTPVAVTASPSGPAVSKLTTTLSLPANPPPTLADAQPLLTQVLQMLESGSGDQLLRLLDGDARRQPGAQALSRQYEQMVRGGRPVHLTQVEFNGEPRDGGVLMVTGRIRLHAGEPTIGSHAQKLVLKAEFAQRGGRVQLTGLSGAPD